MILWRISDHPELDGAGGLRASARWHTAGRPILYCAPNPATALVEVLVHLEIDAEELAEPLQYLEIEAPDTISRERLAFKDFGRAWQTNQILTRAAGDAWLRARRTALFLVPSVVVPATWNILINPLHPESRHLRIMHVHRHSIDPRLLG